MLSTALKTVGQGATNINLVSSAVKGLTAENTAAVLSTTALSETQKISILTAKGLKDEEAKVALATAAHTQAVNAESTALTRLQAKGTGALNVLKGIGATIVAHPILAAITAIGVAASVTMSIINGVKQANDEMMRQASENAETLKDDLKVIDDYKDKIAELQDSLKNDNLSQHEATEKRKELLEIQDELIQKYGREKDVIDSITAAIQGETDALDGLSQSAAKQYLGDNQSAISNAQDFFESIQHFQVNWREQGIGKSTDATAMSIVDDWLNNKHTRSDNFAVYSKKNQTNPWEDTDEVRLYFSGTRDQIVEGYNALYDYIEQYLKDHNAQLAETTKEHLKDLLTNISEARNYILHNEDDSYDNNTNVIDTAVKSALVSSYADIYAEYLSKQEEYQNALATGDQDIITQAYQDVVSAYQTLVNGITYDVGNVKTDTIKNWLSDVQQEFVQANKEQPLIIDIQAELESPESFASKIKEIVTHSGYTQEDINAIIAKGNLGEDLGIAQALYDNIQGYVTMWNEVAKVTGVAEISVEDYINALSQLGIISEEVGSDFKQSFGLSKDQSKELKAIFSDADKLNKVYKDLKNGKTVDINDVAELVANFADLEQYVDWTDEKFGNLAEGIEKVIKERPQDFIKKLQEIDPSNMSDEAKRYIQSLIVALQHINVELETTKEFLEHIKKAIKGVSSSISTLIGFTKEISSDGALSLSSIDTIMTDDTYKSLRPYINDMEGMQTAITELVAKQKDAYEDLYNAEMYENDYEAYHKAVQQKEQENENLLSDSVKQIEDEIKYFNDAYGIDITNWDTLTDTKKNILQNTNAELLSKQNQLINEFEQLYKDDVGNFADAIKDKTEIQKHFEESQVYSKINDLIVNDPKSYVGIDRNTGKTLRYASPELQTEINSILSTYGLSYADYANYRDYGKFTDAGNKALEDYLAKLKDKLVNAYTFTDKDWKTITANIKSTGGSSSSSSSKNYIDWIERRLKKFARTTKEVFAKVADYISFNNQNSQLRKAINAVHDEITANEKAAQAYMDEANSLGLSSDWINKIQNGDYSIQDISNLSDDLKDKINRYQDLYNKVIDCRNAVDELRKTEKEYANQMLSNVEKYYSNRIDYANQDAEYYNSLDTDNLFMNKNFDAIRKSYNEQISYTQKAHDDLLDTLNSLVSSGSIKYQDDEWYEWWAKIQKCDVEVRNLKKSIHDLASEELQNIQDYWDNRIGVYDNTASYLNAVGGDSTRKGSKDYKGLSSAYNTQIEYTNKQVSELQARLDKAVEDGDIEKYSDKWYKWVGIIEQGKEKAVELQTSVHQLAVEQFEEIQKNYDNELNLYEHTAKEYENKNKEIETRGLLANSKYYSKLQENEKDNISILKKQAKDLENSLNQAVQSGNIEVGSEEWYKMRDAIQSVNEQIDEGNIKVLEYAKTIREIGWEVFDFLQDRISQLTTESDFLIDLMSNSKLFDDSGNITAKGKATIGLHTQNYDVYMSQAEQYAEEIREVNAQLMEEPYNTDIIKHRDELLGLQKQSILAAGKEKKAIVDLTKQGFDEQLKSLKKLIETYTKSLDAAKSLYDYQKNINEKTSNISKLQKQLNAYQGDNSEETQARIQQLQTELKEAQEDLQQTEYEKLISDTKSLLDGLYDDYEETLNNRLDNVDALVSDMIGVVNSNSSDINATIKSSAAEAGAVLSQEITDIWAGKGAVNGNIVSNYYNGFSTKLTSVQTTLNNISSYVSILAKAGENDGESTTPNATKKTTTTTTTTKEASTQQGTKSTVSATKVSTPSGTTSKSNSSTSPNKSNTPSKNNTNSSSSNNPKNSNTNFTKTRTDKENYGVALAIINGNYGWGSGEVRKKNLIAKGFNYNTVQGIVNKLWKDGYVQVGAWKGKYYGINDLSPYAYKKYKSGGLVDYTGIAQVDGTPMKPESFLNADDTQNIANLRDILRELAAKPITLENGVGALGTLCGTVTPNILDLSQNLQALSRGYIAHNFNIHNENHIEIGIDKVEDYNDFIMKIQKDRKFENIIQDMTFGRMNGGSSLAKYRH